MDFDSHYNQVAAGQYTRSSALLLPLHPNFATLLTLNNELNIHQYFAPGEPLAADALQDVISVQINAKENSPTSAVQHVNVLQTDNLVVQETSNQQRPVWRLGIINGEGAIEEELSIRMHGILTRVDLTAGNMYRCEAAKVANLCQRVELVGLGSELFSDAIQNLLSLHGAFERFFGAERVIPMNVGDAYSGPRLICTCLYLSKAGPDALAEVPFGMGVDPLGELAKYRKSGLIHTSENQVTYFKSADDGNPRSKHDTVYEAFPATFRAGDIVEVQGSVIGFATKNQKIKTIFQLSTLTLVHSTYSKDAEKARAKAAPPSLRTVTLKRKKWHEQEDREVVKTRRKLKDLDIRGDGPTKGGDDD
ncbi:hypothetical protein R3P38DRAFT_3240424 [Favolaschia claudopus]|uniref:Uncharacterized protein n=1 Tax=Favolaschia claudopus TaxID=2862362 RepID=A0AAV9Z746_9AGAR